MVTAKQISNASSVGRSVLTSTTATQAQIALGLQLNSQVQAWNVGLQSFSQGFAGASEGTAPIKTGSVIVWARPWSPVTQTFSDADVTVAATTDRIIQEAALTAHRAITLPPSNQVAAYREIQIINAGQSYGGCLDLLIAPDGSESIEGLPAGNSFALPWGCNSLSLIRNGANASSQWSVRLPANELGFSYDPQFAGGASSFATERMQTNNSGTGSANTLGGTNPVVQLGTGSTGTGRGSFRTTSFFSPGQGEVSARFRASGVSSLSNATDNFLVLLGISSSTASSTVNHGIFWFYNHATNTGNWTGISRSNNVDSAINSGLGVGTNQTAYNDLGLWLNTTWTEARFFLNGAQIGSTITTNLPTAGGNLSFVATCFKTAGTNGRTVNLSRAATQYRNFLRP